MRTGLAAALIFSTCSASACSTLHPEEEHTYVSLSFDLQSGCPARFDALFVVDSGAGMIEERDNVAANVPAIVRELVSPLDADGDGNPDHNFAQDLRVGVVTADPADGGALRTTGCGSVFPPFLEWDRTTGLEDFQQGVACLADVGIDGTGADPFAMALEAVDSNPTFLREESVFAVFVITDRDQPGPDGDAAEAIHALRPGHPERVVVSAVAGVPEDLVALTRADLTSEDLQDAGDFARILSDPRMDGPTACDAPGFGRAAPSRNLVETIWEVDDVGNNGLVQSICQSDWTPLARSATRLIGSDGHTHWCVSRAIPGENGDPIETGDHAPCVLLEELRDDRPCAPGRIAAGRRDGRTLCHVCQEGDGETDWLWAPDGYDLADCAEQGPAWSYSTTDEACAGRGKVVFMDEEPWCGLVLSLDCVWEV